MCDYNNENDNDNEDESKGHQYFFLYRTTENNIVHEPGTFVAGPSKDKIDSSGFGMEVIERFRLPWPMTVRGFTSWLGESAEAYEMMAECIGSENAKQVQEDTRDVWMSSQEG